MKDNKYKNISPLDHRYYFANQELFDSLSGYLSEEAHIQYMLRVECAILAVHAQHFFPNSPDYLEAIQQAETSITPAEIYVKEEKSQHNVNAIVECLKEHLPKELRSYVHLGATSADIMDTAYVLAFRDASQQIIIPLLRKIECRLLDLAEREISTVQIGRTHGQAAVPITVGYMFAEYISRLGQSILRIMQHLTEVRGTLSGAVGGHHAGSLIYKEPTQFEYEVLQRLGLNAAEFATQILPPEYLLRCLTEYNITFGIIANMADDLRHLQRTEIGELQEIFGKDQVGSSTMPHKRNPWNSEHIKSLWKTFAPRVITFYMDQISEHQRDLTNSASARFIAEYLAGLCAAAARLLKVLEHIHVSPQHLQENMQRVGDRILAEPVYILLALAQVEQAHDTVRKLTLVMEQDNITLHAALKREPDVWQKIVEQMRKIGMDDPDKFFQDSSSYRGKTEELTRKICREYRTHMENLHV